MDSVVDSLYNAYQDFVSAAANVLAAKQNAGALKTTETDTALENFKQKLELFRVACNQAEEFVESMINVIELQYGSGTGSSNSAPSEDAAQALTLKCNSED